MADFLSHRLRKNQHVRYPERPRRYIVARAAHSEREQVAQFHWNVVAPIATPTIRTAAANTMKIAGHIQERNLRLGRVASSTSA